MKIVCVGRNYADHVKELANEMPEDPVIFMKPSTAAIFSPCTFPYPSFSSNVHYECEVVLKIAERGRNLSAATAMQIVSEIGLGIDFTARDLQDQQKNRKQPWEIAKAFDGSGVIGSFLPQAEALDAEGFVEFSFLRNGEVVQRGDTRLLLFPFGTLLAHVTRYFTLEPGDYVFTGTPAGVGPVKPGDLLEAYLRDQKLLECRVE